MLGADDRGGAEGTYGLRFSPRDGGTFVEVGMRMPPKGPMRLAEPLMRRMMGKIVAEPPEHLRHGIDAADRVRESAAVAEMERAGANRTAPARSVELLYFDDCPNYEKLLPHLRQLLRAAGAADEVALRRIADDEAAQRERFLGSPTVRVDGYDVEPGASKRRDFGMKCRLYARGDVLRGTPFDEWVLAALARPAP